MHPPESRQRENLKDEDHRETDPQNHPLQTKIALSMVNIGQRQHAYKDRDQ